MNNFEICWNYIFFKYVKCNTFPSYWTETVVFQWFIDLKPKISVLRMTSCMSLFVLPRLKKKVRTCLFFFFFDYVKRKYFTSLLFILCCKNNMCSLHFLKWFFLFRHRTALNHQESFLLFLCPWQQSKRLVTNSWFAALTLGR